MLYRPIISLALLPCALAMTACSGTSALKPLPVVAEARQCPAFPSPPADLMQPPRKLDFLPEMR